MSHRYFCEILQGKRAFHSFLLLFRYSSCFQNKLGGILVNFTVHKDLNWGTSLLLINFVIASSIQMVACRIQFSNQVPTLHQLNLRAKKSYPLCPYLATVVLAARKNYKKTLG
jgi:hypothetical protein